MSSSVSSSTYTTPTGMTGAGGGDMLRLLGLNSGLDVDSIVKKMMAVEQTKIDKAKQQQQLLQWKQDAYKDIISGVRDLQSTYFDSLNSDTYIQSSNFFSDYTVTPDNASIATETAGIGAKTGTYNITFDSSCQLASSAVKTGSSFNTSQSFNIANWIGKSIVLSINNGSDTTVSFDNISNESNITDVINDINNNTSLSGKLKAVITTDNKIEFQTLTDNEVKIKSTTVSTDLDNIKVMNPSTATTMNDLGLTSTGSLSFLYTGVSTPITIAVNPTDKISDVITKISTKTGGAVTANFSQLTDSFSLSTTLTGSSQTIQVTSDFSSLGLTTDASAIGGQDAIFYIKPPDDKTNSNGTLVSKSSNNFTIDGISYNLLKGENTTFTVSKDADKVYKKISDFIDKYNSVIDKIQTKLNEKQDSDNKYAPLTDSQKSQMSASEISAWEDKAKVGILNNDDNLENLLNDLRSTFASNVSGNILTFGTYGTNPIGIDTYDDYKQGDKLYISDKTKLMDAINNHIDQLSTFFTGTSDLTDKNSKYNAEGVFTRINNILVNNVGNVDTYMNSAILTKYANFQDDYSMYGAGDDNTLPDQIYNQKLLLDKLNDEFSTKQESYYNQFSALETAMETLNEQSNYLSNMLS